MNFPCVFSGEGIPGTAPRERWTARAFRLAGAPAPRAARIPCDDAAPGMPVQSFTIEADGAPAPAVLRAVEADALRLSPT